MRLIDADALWMDVIRSVDYCDDILEFIERQPTVEQPHWIPCSERLPEENVHVLVCDMEEEIYLSHMTRHKKVFDIYGDEIKGLVAWMPLPEPYKKKE